MAKRKEEKQKAGSPAWMSTFSDLMNLLLCFFILLFASSTVDAEKLEQIAASFSKDNIFTAGSTAIGEGRLVSSGVKQLSVVDNYVNSLGRNKDGKNNNLSDVDQESEKVIDANTSEEIVNSNQQSQDSNTEQNVNSSQQSQNSNTEQIGDDQQLPNQGQSNVDNQETSLAQTYLSDEQLQEQVEYTGYAQSEQMSEEIDNLIKNAKISEVVSVSYTAQYVELSLNGGVLFESGDAELTAEAKKLVDKIGKILEKYKKRMIEIEGHTDNVPISSGTYKNNQYLSSARAISVYEYLIDNNNLIAANMKHSGYGDAKPKASNKTAEGRAKNRRVEIKIYNKLNSENN